jgi:adenosylmethionine-8-amino-7-oxononanoate aminotransferase
MSNVKTLPIKISFSQAKQILSKLHKFCCEDYAFGDAESYWVDEGGNEVAGSYTSGWWKVTVWFTDNRVIDCTDRQMSELNNCYLKITRSRNDSLDEYGE